MNKYSIIQSKSLIFAIEIVQLTKTLRNDNEFILATQLLRSGTSIGANIEEAIGALTRRDTISKFSISYKEARECSYWLKLLMETKLINVKVYENLYNKCEELLKIIFKIISNNKMLL